MKKTTAKKTSVSAAVTAAPKAVVTAKPVVTSAAPVIPVTSAKPAPAKSTTATAASAAITIEAKINAGFGNNLFVRGQGAGLSWDRGTPLECVDSQTWRLIVPAKDKLQFKLLLNDTVWAQGDDLVATPGKKVEVTPAF